MSESEYSELIKAQFDLKWISIINLISIFLWWFGYMTTVNIFPSFYRILLGGFSAIFMFFDISALAMATIFTSGFRSKLISYASLILFVLSMIFLFLVYTMIIFRLAGII